MVHRLKVTTVGASLGVVLPDEVVADLEVKTDDTLYLTEASWAGYRLTTYDPETVPESVPEFDPEVTPEFERQMNRTENIFCDDEKIINDDEHFLRDLALRNLAKQ
jgi:hypothetical protein